jgi:chromosome segregation ATPase
MISAHALKQAEDRYRASLGELSAKIQTLYQALEGTEAAEKECKAQSEGFRIAAENLQRELEEISVRYETLKGEKQNVDEELQSKCRALEALGQEKEDEVKKSVAREKRIRSVSAEVINVLVLSSPCCISEVPPCSCLDD